MFFEDLKRDCEQCFELYKSEANKTNLENYSMFSILHNIAFNYIALRLVLNENDETYKFINEIISNTIQVLATFSFIDEKLLFSLNRNSVDNFIKISKTKFNFTEEFSRKKIEKKFNDIASYKSYNQCSKYRSAIDHLLNRYKVYCGYIHSTKIEYMELYSNLRNYYDSKGLNDNNIKETEKFYKKMMFALLFIYKEDIEDKNHDIISNIRSFCYKEDIRDFVKYFFDVNF
jgi:hypothetical protein